MRRTPLKRKTGLKRTAWNRSTSPKIGRSRKNKAETASSLKKKIQAILRLRAIERDGGCVLREYRHWLPFAYQECGPYRKDGELVLQAEHLVTRSHSESYADMDNIVCLCNRHHFYFKKLHGALYWELIKRHIGEERWSKVQQWEQDQRTHRTTHMVTGDWRRLLEKLSTSTHEEFMR